MQIPEWRQRLVRSLGLSSDKPEANYFQLATVNSENQARNRTVVFRGFVDNTSHLTVITDKRSGKFKELCKNDTAEIAWYFAKTREQYRISARVQACCLQPASEDKTLNTHNYLVDSLWNKLSEKTKSSFFNVSPATPFSDEIHNQLNIGSDVSENFCVLVFIPNQVDYLDLNTEPHTRLISRVSPEHASRNASELPAFWTVERVVA
ncbi:pyridoxamine 5'-phosphate oxidase family protein [Agaribacter marinus]|uniref:Pyridoxamine 5'-phosphate oxidase Alr4036 family FMN-binding domain-containing protein n=1 Tax=Agaribacter marinus TaxID=1431249 RepID=A0AA37WG82_9ALTE|nr:pyridoxamine 5'-phosphate oxidase family protein [Agaribacter marinus]GLR69916.1 hypothetical protein GCM10007852_08240 [Agaribacter marinus]